MMTAFVSLPPSGAPAQLTNLRLALSTMLALQDSRDSSQRLGLFYGPSGYGKTVGCAFVAAKFQAAFVEAKSIWTVRSILEAIAAELGIVRMERTSPRLLNQVTEQLIAEPRPLMIDEMDHLVKKQLVEIIRDIHDATRVPILMIGEEALPSKLKAWERFDNRILVATAAQPASAADVEKLRDHYCQRVTLADDLVRAIAVACHGVTRRIVGNLQQVQRLAIDGGCMTVDLAWWQAQDRPLLTGDLQARRRAVA